PDGNWIASVGSDGNIQFWSTAITGLRAAMRVDSALQTCAWIPSSGRICVGGVGGGVYLFELHPP
ncbi:hypothetical protein ACFY36_12910, partial [Actinoplanes sp. NPDC000266]